MCVTHIGFSMSGFACLIQAWALWFLKSSNPSEETFYESKFGVK